MTDSVGPGSRTKKHATFTGWQVVAMVGLCVVPFWVAASDLKDLSELKSTVVGGILIAPLAALFAFLNRRR